MPTPREGESQDEWMERCVPEVMDEGKDHDQAVGQCMGMWNDRNASADTKSGLTQAMQDKVVDLLAHKGKDQGFSVTKAKAAKREAEVLIYGEIGDDLFGGVSAATFAAELKKAGRLDRITLRINSPGGSVFDGMAIYNTLQAHPAQVETHIDGLAASAASIVAMAGQRIYAAENSILMIHSPWALVIGSADEMRAMAASLDKIGEGMAKTYARRTGKSIGEMQKWMEAETWFSAEEAIAAGLADEIAEPMKVAASWDIMAWRKRFRHPPEAFLEELQEPEPAGVPVTAYKDRWRQLERMEIQQARQRA